MVNWLLRSYKVYTVANSWVCKRYPTPPHVQEPQTVNPKASPMSFRMCAAVFDITLYTDMKEVLKRGYRRAIKDFEKVVQVISWDG